MNTNANAAPITEDALSQLMAATTHLYEDCEITEEISIPMRPVTVLEMLAIAREHVSFAEALGADEISYLDLVLKSGPDAIAAFVAASVGKKGKESESFRRWFVEAPDDITLPLGFHAWRRTVGTEGVEGFFTRVREIGFKTGVVQQAASDAA